MVDIYICSLSLGSNSLKSGSVCLPHLVPSTWQRPGCCCIGRHGFNTKEVSSASASALETSASFWGRDTLPITRMSCGLFPCVEQWCGCASPSALLCCAALSFSAQWERPEGCEFTWRYLVWEAGPLWRSPSVCYEGAPGQSGRRCSLHCRTPHRFLVINSPALS